MDTRETVIARNSLRKKRNECAAWSSLFMGLTVACISVALDMPKYQDGGKPDLIGIATVSAVAFVYEALKSVAYSKEAESFNTVLNQQSYTNKSQQQ